MSNVATLNAQPRTAFGSRISRKLRKQGLIPGVVYGHGEEIAHITVSAEEFTRAIVKDHIRTFNLAINGKSDTVLVKDVQWNYLCSEMIHVDFERHSLTERVRVTIPIELKNAPKSMEGGVLDQPLHTLHVECPFGNIPEAVRIDITNLTLGHPVHVQDLKLPEGVVALDQADAVVVHIKLPGMDTTEAALGGVEPEMIREKKVEEDKE